MAVWRLDSSAADLSLFALSVTLLALGLAAARSFEVLAEPLHFTLLSIFAIVAGIALHSAIMGLAATDRRMAIMIRIGMSLMILGWAALMTSQLANIKGLNNAWLVLAPSQFLPTWVPSEVSLLLVLQIGVVLFGLMLALVSLTHVNFRGTSFWTRIGRRTAPLVFAGYAVAVIAILIV
jgi:hypothetical protein